MISHVFEARAAVMCPFLLHLIGHLSEVHNSINRWTKATMSQASVGLLLCSCLPKVTSLQNRSIGMVSGILYFSIFICQGDGL